MKKKIISIALAGTMAASVVAVSAVSASADDSTKAIGGFGVLGEYEPSDPAIKTQRLMLAMPTAWQNDTTKDPRCGGVGGVYWWSGFNTPDDVAGGHGWPGYKTVKVAEQGVDNLFEINVPAYGNGEGGDANLVVWNNFIDGGTEEDPVKNPYYDAACQSTDSPCQYWSRADENELYDPLFRYIYKTRLAQKGVEGVADLDLNSETFWVDINKLAADYNGEDWESLKADEKTYQVDNVLDEMDLDFSEFGDYADNFFNEDLVGEDGIYYPAEESQGFGAAFTFNNMVYVCDFDVAKMAKAATSEKIGLSGNFFFYYGAGEYGSWPTKELNEEMGGVSGNFTTGDYTTLTMKELMDKYYEYHKDDPTTPDPTSATGGTGSEDSSTVPPAASDAASSTSDTAKDSTSGNNSNGAIATGQISFVVIILTVLIAGAGIAFFTRKKYNK